MGDNSSKQSYKRDCAQPIQLVLSILINWTLSPVNLSSPPSGNCARRFCQGLLDYTSIGLDCQNGSDGVLHSGQCADNGLRRLGSVVLIPRLCEKS